MIALEENTPSQATLEAFNEMIKDGHFERIVADYKKIKSMSKPVKGDIVVTHTLKHLNLNLSDEKHTVYDLITYKFSNHDMPNLIRYYKRRYRVSMREFLKIFSITKSQYRQIMSIKLPISEAILVYISHKFAGLGICYHVEVSDKLLPIMFEMDLNYNLGEGKVHHGN